MQTTITTSKRIRIFGIWFTYGRRNVQVDLTAHLLKSTQDMLAASAL